MARRFGSPMLDKLKVPAAEQQELIDIVGSAKGDIVVAPGPKP